MNVIAAQEIKRRGLAAIDEAIHRGPVHIFKNNLPQYVIVTQARYQELIETEEISSMEQIKIALKEVTQGKVHHFANADALLQMIEQNTEN